MRSVFFVCALLWSAHICLSEVNTNTVKQHYPSVKTIDYGLIDRYIRGKKVVLLGEIFHGEKEITLLKTQLVKYLIEHHGFNILAFESSIYDFDENTPLSYKEAIYPVWADTYAFQEMLSYLNCNKFVKVVGFDNQLSNNIEALFDVFDECDLVLNKEEEDYFFNILETIVATRNLPENFVFIRFNTVLSKIEKSTTNIYLQKYCDNIRSYVKFLCKYGDVRQEDWKAEYSNIRDKKMAENLLFLYKHNKNSKIICWGANGHFANDFKAIANEELMKFKPMGFYLRRHLGDELLSIAFSAKKGVFAIDMIDGIDSIKKLPPYSIENQINLKKQESVKVIELQKLKGKNTFANLIEFNRPIQGDFSKLFDLVIVMDSISPVKYGALKMNSSKKLLQNDTEQKTYCIVNTKTGKPIEFCNIYYLSDSSVGTASDINGKFQIKMLQDTLLFSCLGYQQKKIFYKDIPSVVEMTPNVKEIEEVVVWGKSRDPKVIMRNVIDRLSLNYNENGYSHLFNITKLFVVDKDTIINIKALKKVFVRNSFKKGSNNLYQESYDSIVSVKQKKSYYPNNRVAILNLNTYLAGMNLLCSNIKLFDKKKFRKYRFSINKTLSNNKEYVINFKAKKNNFNYTNDYWGKSFYGKFYINKKDFAITRLDYVFERNLTEFNSLVLNRKKGKELVYSKDRYFTSLNFTKKNGFYYLSRINRKLETNYYDNELKKEIKEQTYFNVTWIENTLNVNTVPLKEENNVEDILN